MEDEGWELNYGSLFSGAGLGDFGFELAGLECKWQVENNKYCRKILDLRWPGVKKYGNIKEVKTEELEKVDLITGGFPCQPFSIAGKRVGEDDNRNLWPEMFRIIKDLKPRWVVAENVPGIISLYLDNVLSDLESEDYTCWPIVFSSHSLGAWHRRERLWIIAFNSNSKLCRRFYGQTQKQPAKRGVNAQRESKPICTALGYSKHDGLLTTEERGSIKKGNDRNEARTKQTSKSKGPDKQYAPMDNPLCRRQRTQKRKIQAGRNSTIYTSWWATEPGMGRVVNGCANRVDRLKALGNGQTPCSTFLIGQFIMEKEKLQ